MEKKTAKKAPAPRKSQPRKAPIGSETPLKVAHRNPFSLDLSQIAKTTVKTITAVRTANRRENSVRTPLRKK